MAHADSLLHRIALRATRSRLAAATCAWWQFRIVPVYGGAMTATKLCKMCKAEIPAEAKKCMHCGTMLGSTSLNRVIVIVVVALIISALIIGVMF